MIRRLFTYISLVVLAVSCTQKMSGPQEFGAMDLRVSSDVEVDVSTKSDDKGRYDAYNISLYGIRTGNDPYSASVVYGQIAGPLTLPYGLYSVEAESCTESQAHEGFGCVRFYGKTEGVQVKRPADNPTPVSVECRMANSRISVSFDEGFVADFESVSVDLSMGERLLTITPDNSSTALAYFNVSAEGSVISYAVKGSIDGVGRTYSSSILLMPAKHARLTFKSNHNGMLGPQVTVDAEIGTNEITGTINPGSGTPVTGGDIEKPVIYVDYQIKDAVVVETVIDVIDKEDMTL